MKRMWDENKIEEIAQESGGGGGGLKLYKHSLISTPDTDIILELITSKSDPIEYDEDVMLYKIGADNTIISTKFYAPLFNPPPDNNWYYGIIVTSTNTPTSANYIYFDEVKVFTSSATAKGSIPGGITDIVEEL